MLPAGPFQLATVELDCAAVKAAGRVPTTLPGLLKRAKSKTPGALPLDWASFYQAMAVTSILRDRVPRAERALESLAHALRYARHFAPGGLGLVEGASGYYKDAEQGAFASRVGEAAGYLFAIGPLGRPDVAHFDLAKRILRMPPRVRLRERPDYLLRGNGRLALAEFKGCVRRPSRGPPLGRTLRKALDQCDAAARLAKAPLDATYAVATVVCEASSGFDPYVCWADPEPDGPQAPETRRAWEDAVVRASLGARLALAGFEDLANALWRGDEAPRRSPGHARKVLVETRHVALVRAADDPVPWRVPRIGVDARLVHRAMETLGGRDHPFADWASPPPRGRRGTWDEVDVLADGLGVLPGERWDEADVTRL